MKAVNVQGGYPSMNTAPYPELGINLNHMADWILNGAFTNMFNESLQWTGSPTLDSNGWPTAGWPTQSKITNNVGTSNVRTGTHIIYFDGTGTIILSGSASATVTVSGTQFNVVTPVSGGININISASNASPNHVRNIRIVHSEDAGVEAAGGVFTTRFKNYIRSLGTTIRFMDPMATNTSAEILWADRPTATYYNQNSSSAAGVGSTTKGMCIEHVVTLCNETSLNLWVNVPHRADDTYVTNLFDYIATNLRTSLICYIELSNEVWNSTFDRASGDGAATDNGQYTYFVTLANSLGLGGANNSEKRQRAYKRRAVEVFNIAETEFGGTSRIRRVLCGQRGSTTILDYSLNFESSNNSKIDYLSIAAYYGAAVLNSALNTLGKPLTNTDYFNHLESWTPVSTALDAADISYYNTTWGKEVVAYEGGLVSEIASSGGWATDAALHSLVNSAMSDTRMAVAYRNWMHQCKLSGYKLLMHYGAVYPFPSVGSTAGRWGLRETVYKTSAESQKQLAWTVAAGLG